MGEKSAFIFLSSAMLSGLHSAKQTPVLILTARGLVNDCVCIKTGLRQSIADASASAPAALRRTTSQWCVATLRRCNAFTKPPSAPQSESSRNP